MICTDVYSDDENEDIVVYGDQCDNSRRDNEDPYGELMETSSDEDKIVNYNVALRAQDNV